MRAPPPKTAGMQKGPRTMNGYVMDVAAVSAFCGWSEKKTRAMFDRRLLPFRRLGGRLVCLRPELEAYLLGLEGCPLAEAKENVEARQAVRL